MESLLIQAGLNEIQAKAYLYLLEKGEQSPPALAAALGLTRSNAYKVLEKLLEVRLISRIEINKKFVYRAEDPISLASLVAAERNRVLALEKGVQAAMHELRSKYEKTSTDKSVRSYHGNELVASLYKSQAQKEQPIYFIKSRADIPVMGYETMNRVRHLPAKNDIERYGITQDAPEAVANPAIDRETNLTRTWIDCDDYTSPVEWSVAGDELLIINFEKEASAIRIKDPLVARAFKELWQLLDRSIRKDPAYRKLPKQAGRKV